MSRKDFHDYAIGASNENFVIVLDSNIFWEIFQIFHQLFELLYAFTEFNSRGDAKTQPLPTTIFFFFMLLHNFHDIRFFFVHLQPYRKWHTAKFPQEKKPRKFHKKFNWNFKANLREFRTSRGGVRTHTHTRVTGTRDDTGLKLASTTDERELSCGRKEFFSFLCSPTIASSMFCVSLTRFSCVVSMSRNKFKNIKINLKNIKKICWGKFLSI